MRNFLKNNALAILVCLAAMGTFASATTITRPYGASDYAGGTKAVGAKVNAEFASIVAWLNSGNIDSTNIATSGVATANIQALAVTTAKIANLSVTPGKLEAANIKVTSSSSLYTLTNTVTPATVTNLSTTFTPSGLRPLSIRLENNVGNYVFSGNSIPSGLIEVAGAGALTVGNNLFFVKDGSTTVHFPIALTSGTRVPCSMFNYTEFSPSAGTYTYALKASNGNTSDTGISVVNCRLVVEEL